MPLDRVGQERQGNRVAVEEGGPGFGSRLGVRVPGFPSQTDLGVVQGRAVFEPLVQEFHRGVGDEDVAAHQAQNGILGWLHRQVPQDL